MKNCWKQLAAVPSDGKQKNKSGEKNHAVFITADDGMQQHSKKKKE
jgi:hypothetical protein